MTHTGNRRWVVVPGLLGLVLLLMLGTISAGLRLPGLSQLAGLPGFGTLDYRTLNANAISPLRPGYVDELLGTDLVGGTTPAPVGTPSALPARDRGSSTPTGSPASTLPGSRLPIEDQSFTNDDLASPRVITSLPFAARTDNRTATRTKDEPSSCSQSGGTAWYRYTARRTGVLFTDTIGTDHATALGVFSINRAAALTQIGCATGATGDAQLGFAVVQGGTYLFQVAGVVGGGRLVFRLSALGRTSLVSSGAPVGDSSRRTAISGNGQVLAFSAQAGIGCLDYDFGCVSQVFVVDRRTGRTTLISRSRSGGPGNGASTVPSLSDDGRYIGFSSGASDLVAGDTNETWDYFVHDRRTGRTERASVSSSEQEGQKAINTGAIKLSIESAGGWLSPDGRFASFWTDQDGLAGGEASGARAYVRDLRAGTTTLESRDAEGRAGPVVARTDIRISRGGRYVAFISESDLARDPEAPCSRTCGRNVYLRDRQLGITRLVSVTRNGRHDGRVRFDLDMSDDGRTVAWSTESSLGDPADTNGIQDVYVIDLRRDAPPRRVSVSVTGQQQESTESTSGVGIGGLGIDVSGDGSRVAFHSDAPNLVPNDRNAVVDVFVRDLGRGTVTRVSTSSTGVEGNGDSYRPVMSYDGRVLVFESESENLVDDDGNRLADAFVHDLSGV